MVKEAYSWTFRYGVVIRKDSDRISLDLNAAIEDQEDLHAHYLVVDTLSGALTTTAMQWLHQRAQGKVGVVLLITILHSARLIDY